MTTTTTTSLPLVPGPWALDTNHSSVGFTIRHLGVSKVRGHFRTLRGRRRGRRDARDHQRHGHHRRRLDRHRQRRPRRPRAQPRHRRRDEAARRSCSARRRSPATATTTWSDGDLTIGEVTRPVTLAVELGGVETFPGGGPRHAGFEATTEIRRSDFGIDIAMPPGVSGVMLGDVVKIELDLQLLEP